MKQEELLRPTVFVVMPYGVKRDPASGVTIDFDDVWQTAFEPAAHGAGVEPIRADEEHIGGFVHLAMFERLLLAEIVLADLTLASPNVMYELGIRHATRPRATVSVFARIGQLPFDVSPIRALPYSLDHQGRLTDDARTLLVDQLTERLGAALVETAPDSPLFQLIRSYPGVTLPHDVTETFQNRVRTITTLSSEIHSARERASKDEAVEALRALARQIRSAPTPPTELLMDLLLAYRDVEAYDEMIAMADSLPDEVRDHPAVHQLTAFALNRRRRSGDDARAIDILQRLLEQHGDDPETLGLLGRVHKDRHERLREGDPFQAEAALDAAIDTYERGFRADMRDYYPGVNAVTLLMTQGSDDSYQRARELSPVVAFAVAARGGIESSDYWDVATVLELSAVNLDAQTALRSARRLLYLGGPAWRRQTTSDNLERLRCAHKSRGQALGWLDDIIEQIRPDDDGQ